MVSDMHCDAMAVPQRAQLFERLEHFYRGLGELGKNAQKLNAVGI
jgi:hypothetical protein